MKLSARKVHVQGPYLLYDTLRFEQGGIYMSVSALRRFVVMTVVALVLAAYAFAENQAGLVGKWNMTSESTGDPLSWVLVIKEADGKLTGSLSSPDGEASVKELTYTDGVLRFKAPYQEQYYDVELKYTGNKLDGTWSGNGDSGRTYGTKAAATQ
jgi:hypothetical protein